MWNLKEWINTPIKRINSTQSWRILKGSEYHVLCLNENQIKETSIKNIYSS